MADTDGYGGLGSYTRGQRLDKCEKELQELTERDRLRESKVEETLNTMDRQGETIRKLEERLAQQEAKIALHATQIAKYEAQVTHQEAQIVGLRDTLVTMGKKLEDKPQKTGTKT